MTLIADSGSTKTDWRLVLPGGRVKAFKTKGFNPYFQEVEAIVKEIEHSLLPELLLMGNPDKIYFYGAGCANEEKCNILKIALQQCFPKTGFIEVASDMLGAVRGLCGSSPGVVAILGTGANSCYYNGFSIVSRQPSLGFILGDEGSGAYLGKTLVRAFLYHELPPSIRDAFQEKYHLTKDGVVEAVYRKPFPNSYLASFAPFIKGHIEHGYMQNLVYTAFDAFFEHHICKYGHLKEIQFNATGSIAFNFEDILCKVAKNRDIRVGIISESPMDGLLQYHTE